MKIISYTQNFLIKIEHLFENNALPLPPIWCKNCNNFSKSSDTSITKKS